jgi:aspartate aminotransferase/aminotransferase
MDTAIGDDVIHLEVGQPDFASPDPVIEAACEAARDPSGVYTKYTPNMGYASLREALVEKLRDENGIETHAGRILVTPGSNYGIMIALSVLLRAGDEVLIPDPGYVNYGALPPQYGAKVVRYPLAVEDGFEPRIDVIADRITPKTKMIVHNSPSNPTGAVASEKFTKELVELARANDLYVFSDEAYEHIVFEGGHFSPGRYDDDEGRVVSVFSCSKSYAMTGWRIGYVVANEAIARALEKQQELCCSCAPAVSQKAAEAAIHGVESHVRAMVERYQRRRDLAVDILRKHDRLSYTPHGAFYILIDITSTGMDSDAFADQLLREHRVAAAPGKTFGEVSSSFIRITMAADDAKVAEGLERICKFIDACS